MSEDQIKYIADILSDLNVKLDKMFELLSERSKDVITKEMGGEKGLESPKRENGINHTHGEFEGKPPLLNSKPPIVSEHVSGVNLEEDITVTEQMLMDLTVFLYKSKKYIGIKKKEAKNNERKD